MLIYVFGMNWNPLEQNDESYLTTIKIPAKDHEEAGAKLVALLGRKIASKCFLNDYYKY